MKKEIMTEQGYYLSEQVTPQDDVIKWWKKLTMYGRYHNPPTIMIALRRLTAEQIAEIEAYTQHFIDLRQEHGFFDNTFIADRKKELEIIAKFKRSLHVSR